jgi:hypothetical protein
MRVFAGTAVSPKIAHPFRGTIWLERSGATSRKPLRHSHFDVVPGGTLNPLRQYLKLSLRERSVPPRILGVGSGTIAAELDPSKPHNSNHRPPSRHQPAPIRPQPSLRGHHRDAAPADIAVTHRTDKPGNADIESVTSGGNRTVEGCFLPARACGLVWQRLAGQPPCCARRPLSVNSGTAGRTLGYSNRCYM